MKGVLGHNTELKGYIGAGTTWANKTNFGMNHAQGAGLISDLLTCRGSFFLSSLFLFFFSPINLILNENVSFNLVRTEIKHGQVHS